MLPELTERLTILDRKREAFLTAVRASTHVQQTFRPGSDSWSMLDVTEHLVLAEEKSLLGMLKGPPPGMSVTPLARIRMKMVRLVMATELKVKVPVARVIPTGSVALPVLESRWLEARRGLEEFLVSIDATAANAPRFRHPIGGWVTAWDGVAFFAGHIDHHARQLRRIRRSPGFPVS